MTQDNEGVIGVYIHIPFCRAKCSYCDFFSITGREDMIEEYVDAIAKEIEAQAYLAGERKVGSVFFGGGTPSLLTPAHVEKVIEAIHTAMKIAPAAEITMELNPESVTEDSAAGYLKAGVNRASLGVQSLDAGQLAFLKRIHTAYEARDGFEILSKAGFTNLSVDLIYGLPHETESRWIAQLREIASWAPSHVSCYELTPEPGTLLFEGVSSGMVVFDEDQKATLDDATEAVLASFHYKRYEVSNYARPGFQCVHNLGYWLCHDYLGIGASAHSLINGVRRSNIKQVEGYISRIKDTGAAVSESETQTTGIIMTERLMMGLRLTDGVVFAEEELTDAIKKQIDTGVLEYVDGHLRATRDKGFMVLNSVLASL